MKKLIFLGMLILGTTIVSVANEKNVSLVSQTTNNAEKSLVKNEESNGIVVGKSMTKKEVSNMLQILKSKQLVQGLC